MEPGAYPGGTIQARLGHTWYNFSGTEFRSKEYYEPTDRNQLRRILGFAATRGQKVRVVGCGHSYNRQVACDDVSICMTKMNAVLEVDKARMTVKGEAGATLRHLIDVLATHGLAFTVLSAVPDVTLGGAICTGTHSLGTKFGSLSTYVVELEMMTSSGEIVTISRTDDVDVYRAACLSLGALGVLLSVTMRCERAFNLEQVNTPVDLDHVLPILPELATKSQHFALTWMPYAGAVIRQTNRTDKPPSRYFSFIIHVLVCGYLVGGLYFLSTFIRGLVPWINRFVYRVVLGRPGREIDRSDRIFILEGLPNAYSSEWLLPIENVGPALRELRTWIETNRWPVDFIVEVRSVAPDDLLLSPTNGRLVCCIQTLILRMPYRQRDRRPYFNALAEISGRHDGRPHWAKDIIFDPDKQRAIFPGLDKFLTIRRQMDPLEMFLTPYIARMLGIKDYR